MNSPHGRRGVGNSQIGVNNEHWISMSDEFLQPVAILPSQEQINNAIRVVRYSTINEPLNNTCPITTETFENDQDVTQIIYCGHVFTTQPLLNWFQSSVRCPLCRYDIRNYSVNERNRYDSRAGEHDATNRDVGNQSSTQEQSESNNPYHRNNSSSLSTIYSTSSSEISEDSGTGSDYAEGTQHRHDGPDDNVNSTLLDMLNELENDVVNITQQRGQEPGDVPRENHHRANTNSTDEITRTLSEIISAEMTNILANLNPSENVTYESRDPSSNVHFIFEQRVIPIPYIEPSGNSNGP